MGAIKKDSTGWAWGGSIMGFPIQIISDVYFLDASSTTISYIKYDGTVWSIGKNTYGNFGNGVTSSPSSTSITPSKMQNITNAVRVSNNSYTTIVLLSDSSLWSVGGSFLGHLGLGTGITQTLTPMPIVGIPKIIDIKSNADGVIALSFDGDVYSWGKDYITNGSNFIPIQLVDLTDIVAISGCDDGNHFMALDKNKNCYAWGNNSNGQCGVSVWMNTNTPLLVETDVVDIMAGETFSYLVKSDGSLWASGSSKVISGSSIWLNLPDVHSEIFTQLDPSAVPEACELMGITPFTTPCNETTFGSITIENFGGQSPYTYSIGDAFQSSNVFTNLGAGNYTITVKDVNGCQYSTTTNIYGINCPSPPTPIEPIPPLKEPYINFPNVFSPNGDGENDLFYFPNKNVNELYCKIYNRWGNLVYEFTQINEGWNGRTNSGKECSEGTYFYIVTYKFQDSDVKKVKGFVTLLR
jgi:gliding motility-associated-like protein